jgi:hypothetical protein
MTTLRRLLGLFLVFALLSCTRGRTQIVLLMETDMPQGQRALLTHVRIKITAQGSTTARQDLMYALRPTDATNRTYELPGTLGITALDNDGTRSVKIEITAIQSPGANGSANTDLFTYTAIAPFEEEQTSLLQVFLANRCVLPANQVCLPDQTCGRFGCESQRRTQLPTVNPDYNSDAAAQDIAVTETSTMDLVDVGNDMVMDGSRDDVFDAAVDVVVEAASDHIDAAIDAMETPLIVPDVTMDVRPDVGVDVGTDVRTDVVRDAGADSVVDAGPDVPVDVPRDIQPGADASDMCTTMRLVNCEDRCVDTQTDPENCGDCGNSCLRIGSTLNICVRGACASSGAADADTRPDVGTSLETGVLIGGLDAR